MLHCDLTSSNYITPETSLQKKSEAEAKGQQGVSLWFKACGHCHAEIVLLTTIDQGLTSLMLIRQLTEYLWWMCGAQSCFQTLWSLQFSVPFLCSSTAMADKGHHQDGGIKATTGWRCFSGFCCTTKERVVEKSPCGKVSRQKSHFGKD